MTKVLAITNQKGGVGKTTTAVNLSTAMSLYKKKILLIDIDPQGNTSSGIGLDRSKVKRCIYDVLINQAPIREIILHSKIKNLDVLPSTIQLVGAEIELVNYSSRENKLQQVIKSIKDDYDYIIIDCPPSLGLLTLNSLTAADSVIIPVQCEYYALEGIGQLLNTINLVKEILNPSLEIEGILLTMYDTRTNLSRDVIEEVKKNFKGKIFKSIIPRNVRVSEAPSYGQPVVFYDAKSKGAIAYKKLAQEVISNG
ncbi:MAG: sporulation initiation inhibitor Soj [Candidatus Infernicultor aquiphilus]|uniref:Sporulation initiation inhibitor Soj n=1 Tax=Candidatus Infernicultor aquiphilus TaxID=1805029 RepID=A0A1J5GL34_9BACT|nr:ParA family protein [bacterium]OIP69343.1 MAG: sporulation initiation inhibitor Soj [Candidatus Atribacteria bacterium CG2_30_33_13]PIU25606.1 MAG: sporulation initiation inhibitor Soj [Candidatus Atribacteria bacterium CG08_land_8_20_14_0_20_33_29]PIW11359.1 MAG: sporulation initiation inhibitor Soj [Candidatus Atribacteria bacterium CG17_big_fil_post_rev_8_21_14_2_50_34_11]PIX34806.1 MAG: sporulation initiation inhibitor Soj [Candidatus Atribacteria bacterium CG_4_8_14_3_um_filter_34_18]P